MNLKPINPFYKKRKPVARKKVRSAVSTYSYPYDWIEPVTDRTQEDVDHAKELIEGWYSLTEEQKAEYLAGLKGCLNSTDLERMENNIQILIDVLELDKESHVGAVPEIPTASYMADLKANVTAIREGYFVHAYTPEVPDAPYNTFQKFNDMEKILEDVHEVVSSQFSYYAGNEIYAGDETGLLL